MKKAIKKSAPRQFYVSPKQGTLDSFKTPFEQQLDPKNRWVVFAQLVPQDEVCNIYLREVGVSETGRPSLNPRIILGAIIIKHLGNLDALKTHMETKADEKKSPTDLNPTADLEPPSDQKSDPPEPEHKGRLIFDTTACPQDIAYPTDLKLLSDAREKSEELIDQLYDPELHPKKPRTYREIARNCYLKTVRKKNNSGNLVKLAWVALPCNILNRAVTFSARLTSGLMEGFQQARNQYQ